MADTFRWDPTLGPAHTHRVTEEGTAQASLTLGDLPTVDVSEGGAGHYVRQRTLGEGGMGVVTLAQEPALDREVALKELRRHSAAGVEALLHEARMMGTLEHPNIIPVHALGVDDTGAPVLVMKRVHGETWETLIDAPEHPGWAGWTGPDDPLERNVAVLLDVCDAVAFAHDRGVVHRDVKPENVMIGGHGEVYLLDFGVAARVGSRARRAVGTPAYMAPEMTAPGEVCPAMDVFLLGAVLTRLLSGTVRNVGATVPEALAAAHVARAVAFGPAADEELAALANQACAHDPADRPPSVRAFRDALRTWQTHLGARALARAAADQLEAYRRAGRGAERDRAFSASRFGFQQALARWPEQPSARGRFAELLHTAVADAAERQADLDSALGWLDELAELDPERAGPLRSELDEARDQVAARRARDRDADLTVGGRRRAVFFGISAVLGVLITIPMFAGVVDPWQPRDAFFVALGFCVFYAVGSVASLLWLQNSQATRNFALLVLVLVLAMLSNRWVAWQRDLPISWMYSVDLLMMTVGGVGAGAYVRQLPLLTYGTLCGAGYVTTVLWPDAAVVVFGVAIVVGTMAFAFELARAPWR